MKPYYVIVISQYCLINFNNLLDIVLIVTFLVLMQYSSFNININLTPYFEKYKYIFLQGPFFVQPKRLKFKCRLNSSSCAITFSTRILSPIFTLLLALFWPPLERNMSVLLLASWSGQSSLQGRLCTVDVGLFTKNSCLWLLKLRAVRVAAVSSAIPTGHF